MWEKPAKMQLRDICTRAKYLIVHTVKESWHCWKQSRFQCCDVIHQQLDVTSEEADLSAIHQQSNLSYRKRRRFSIGLPT